LQCFSIVCLWLFMHDIYDDAYTYNNNSNSTNKVTKTLKNVLYKNKIK
jgi:hypothetical protein